MCYITAFWFILVDHITSECVGLTDSIDDFDVNIECNERDGQQSKIEL